MRKISICLIIAGCQFFSLYAFGAETLPGPPGQEGRHVLPFSGTPSRHEGFLGGDPVFHKRFPEYLCLSPEQRDRMSELSTRHARETRDLRYEMAVKQLEMQKLFADPQIGDSVLLAKEKELDALRQKLHEKTVLTMLASRKILTSDQLAKLDHLPPPPGIAVIPALNQR